jgi:hypothetical protein
VFYGWWIVAVSFAAQAFAVGLTTYAFGLFQKPVAAEFDASFQEVGLGMTLMGVAGAIFAPFLGRALDRRSIRGIMVLGCVVSPGMLALGPNGSAKVVANWFVRRRGQALGICAAGTSAGGFLAPPLIAMAIEAFGWRGALACLALVVTVLAIPLVWLVIADRPEDRGLAPDGDDAALQPAAGAATPAAEWTFGALLRERNFHREGFQAILVREGSTSQARGLEPGQILAEPALPPAQDATPDGAAGSSEARGNRLSRNAVRRTTATRAPEMTRDSPENARSACAGRSPPGAGQRRWSRPGTRSESELPAPRPAASWLRS